MSIGVLHGQNGGSGLAVKVVGGLQKPSNAKQGAIWVNTDQKITGWTMQVEEPTEPTEGMVWIAILTHARLNALKKNGIWFTPTSAKQYSNGGWVKKTGEYYNNGQWVALFEATIHITYPAGSTCKVTNGTTTLTAPNTSGTWACVVPNAGTWTVTATKGSLSKSSDVSITTNGQSASVTLSYTLNLFDSGNQYTSTTGGWSVTSGYGDVGSSVINLYTGENGQNSIAGTKNLIDISDFSTLNVTVTAQSGSCYARVVDSSGTTLANISISGTGTKMLDISSLSTAAYIRVGCSGTSSSPNTNLKVSNVWLS